MILTTTEQRLLNNYQREFPLISDPFRVVAEQVNSDTATVLALLKRFQDNGVISRVGPVFRPNTVGSSTLAAMSVPEHKLITVANRISAYPEVNHNYEREHKFNLWFVINTATKSRRDAVLGQIERETGCKTMSLPLVRDYHIDLGFNMDFTDAAPDKHAALVETDNAFRPTKQLEAKSDFISTLQHGLPLVRKPYAKIAECTGLSENIVLQRISDMINSGTIKRFGVVVRHHELGYRANAMCVWNVPDNKVDAVGERLAKKPYVTLCYRRPRRLPHWPYNLFCMIHGKHRTRVIAQIEELAEQFDLAHLPRSVLFSGRRFKQRGAQHRAWPDLQPDPIPAAHG